MQITSSLEGLSLWWFPILRDIFKLLEIGEKINLERVRLVDLVIVGRLDCSERIQVIVVFQKNVSAKKKKVFQTLINVLQNLKLEK